MINVAHGTQIYLATGATDMRRGFNGLQGQIADVLKQVPLSGHLFMFFNRRRDRLKILYWGKQPQPVPLSPLSGAILNSMARALSLDSATGYTI